MINSTTPTPESNPDNVGSTDAIRESMSRDTLDRPGGEQTFKIKLTRRTVAKAKDFLWRLFG